MLSWDDTGLKWFFILGIGIPSFIFSVGLTFILSVDKEPENNNESELEDYDINNDKSEEKEKEKNLIDDKENKKMNLKRKDNNDENNNSKIINIDVEIKFALTFLGRILITIYSFQGLFFLYNFIFQYLALSALIFYFFEDFPIIIQIIATLIYMSIAILTSNVLVIPTYEFLSFPFLKYNNPFSHLESFRYIYRDKKFNCESVAKKNYPLLNIFLSSISIIYLIGFLLGLISEITFFKVISELCILFFVYIYYLTVIFCYFLISVYIIIWHNPLKFKNHIFPDINLLSYSLNPIYNDNYEGENNEQVEVQIYGKRNQLRVFFCLVLLYTTCSSTVLNKGTNWFLRIIEHFSLILFIFSLSIILNFPFCYKNQITFGSFLNSKKKLKSKVKYPVMVPAIRVLCDILFLLVSSALCLAFYMMKEQLNEDIIDFDDFNQIFENKVDSEDQLLPSICRTSIYNIPLYLYIPFINDAYYYNKTNNISKKSSFNYENYKNIFFNDNYTIEIENLIEGNEDVKMVRYDIESKEENVNVTILSIKGTSHKKDLYLDLQLFMPSVFLNLLSTFSIFGDENDSFNSKMIEYGLSIPYRLFGEFLFVDDYIHKLEYAYKNTSSTFRDNVVIVGHSLGGGLSKILGRITKTQAISLSGPGINAFHTNWTSDGNSGNFDLSFIDLIPDKDLIPRVEVSGGTIYRIVCNKSPFKCHDKALSLCETLIMCRSKYYKFYCYILGGLKNREINEIKKYSSLRKKNKK